MWRSTAVHSLLDNLSQSGSSLSLSLLTASTVARGLFISSQAYTTSYTWSGR